MKSGRPTSVLPFAVREAGQRLPLLVDVNHLTVRIGLKNADRGCLGKAAETRFAFRQGGRLLHRLGHVGQGTDPAHETSLGIELRLDSDLDIPDRLVGQQRTDHYGAGRFATGDQALPSMQRRPIRFDHSGKRRSAQPAFNRCTGGFLPPPVEIGPAPGPIDLEHDLADPVDDRGDEIAAAFQLGAQFGAIVQDSSHRQANRDAGGQKRLQCDDLLARAAVDQRDGAIALQGCQRRDAGEHRDHQGRPEPPCPERRENDDGCR